jgi:hypothetical protein
MHQGSRRQVDQNANRHAPTTVSDIAYGSVSRRQHLHGLHDVLQVADGYPRQVAYGRVRRQLISPPP